MKYLRTVTVILFAGVLCVFAWFYYYEMVNADATLPAIMVAGGTLEVSIQDDDDRLMEGVTAYDEKDGDITEKVIIESVSQLGEDGTCTVTYAVADGDNHVAKNTRQIRYRDYTSPRFTVSQALVFPVGSAIRISNLIGAEDCIDGDISEKVLISATNLQMDSVGSYDLSMQVGNSKGDIVYLDLPVYVEEWNQRAPVIELSEYLIYVPQGQELDFESYITSVTTEYSTLEDRGVLITQDYDPNVPGVYSIHYYAWDVLKNEGHTVLTVVVEG